MSLPSFPSPGAWRPMSSSESPTSSTDPAAGPSVTRSSISSGTSAPPPVGGGASVGSFAPAGTGVGLGVASSTAGGGGSGSGGGPGGGGGGGGAAAAAAAGAGAPGGGGGGGGGAATGSPTIVRAASMNAEHVAKRSSGFFAIAFSITSSRAAGRSGRAAVTCGTG